jgi:hypothetical protein
VRCLPCLSRRGRGNLCLWMRWFGHRLSVRVIVFSVSRFVTESSYCLPVTEADKQRCITAFMVFYRGKWYKWCGQRGRVIGHRSSSQCRERNERFIEIRSDHLSSSPMTFANATLCFWLCCACYVIYASHGKVDST